MKIHPLGSYRIWDVSSLLGVIDIAIREATRVGPSPVHLSSIRVVGVESVSVEEEILSSGHMPEESRVERFAVVWPPQA